MEMSERLQLVRIEMKKNNLDAYIIPTSDPHGSEYPATRWASRAWIANFHGSCGSVVVTATKAGLWTDGRYHIFAEELLADQPMDLFKQGLPETPTINAWLIDELPQASCIGFDGRLFSTDAVRTMKKDFVKSEFTLSSEFDLMGNAWADRPGAPDEQNFDHLLKYAGASRVEKLTRLREKMTELGADTHVLTVLDDISWLYNMRLVDVMPAFGQAYTIVTQTEATLFIDAKSIVDIKKILITDGITILPYDSIISAVQSLPETATILLSSKFTNWEVYNACPTACQIIDAENPVRLFKSMKNEVEITNTKNAHHKDGVAMVRLVRWIEANLDNDITEWDVYTKADEFRRQQPLSFGQSFATIPGYKANAAMMHYAPSATCSSTLEREGFLLIDSGGQYTDGLTDTTRTLMLGPVSDEMKKYYTLVLKGMISLSMAKFPKGTTGTQLDVLARQPLWNEGANFRCGTGHGVGYFLNVHEGPQYFSQHMLNVPLELGMMTTIEPGYYPAGEYGIRIENIVLTTSDETTEYGEYYKFEFLTLCPIDTKPILIELLSAKEISYLNSYHKTVYNKLSPLLTAEESAWLKEVTKSI